MKKGPLTKQCLSRLVNTRDVGLTLMDIASAGLSPQLQISDDIGIFGRKKSGAQPSRCNFQATAAPCCELSMNLTALVTTPQFHLTSVFAWMRRSFCLWSIQGWRIKNALHVPYCAILVMSKLLSLMWWFSCCKTELLWKLALFQIRDLTSFSPNLAIHKNSHRWKLKASATYVHNFSSSFEFKQLFEYVKTEALKNDCMEEVDLAKEHSYLTVLSLNPMVQHGIKKEIE